MPVCIPVQFKPPKENKKTSKKIKKELLFEKNLYVKQIIETKEIIIKIPQIHKDNSKFKCPKNEKKLNVIGG